jgi:hypothetical protein
MAFLKSGCSQPPCTFVVVDQAPDRPRDARIAVIPDGVAHRAGFHPPARHLDENLLSKGPECLDRCTRPRLANVRVQVSFPMRIA